MSNEQTERDHRERFFALYGLTLEEAALIKEGFVRYRHGIDLQWSKTPIEGWSVDRDSILPSTMHVPRFERDYNGRRYEVTSDGLERLGL